MEYNNTNNKGYGFALVLIGALFFSFGFITWANSQLIPYLRLACELTDAQSYLVATAFFAAYFVMSLPSSYVLKLTGFKNGMSLGLLIMAVGALLFIPAANARNYPLFLTGLFIIGSGLALLQTASNPYATILGPIESAARRISIMGICNKLAGALSVYILGGIILKDADAVEAHINTLAPDAKAAALDLLAQKVITPYVVIAIALTLLAIIFYFIKLPEVTDEETTIVKDSNHTGKNIFSFPHLWSGVLALFFYVGVEVISYDTFTGFGKELGYSTDVAKNFATYTAYGLLAGYLLGIACMPRYISQRKALVLSVILSMVLVLIACFSSGTIAVTAFALLGFSNAVVWPAIWPLSLDRLGSFTKTASALLVMAIVGGAVLPPVYGKISEIIGSKQLSYLIMIPCYLYILYFALRGYKQKEQAI
jgi:FHS family L-fucose permease-like MFS transporter